MNYQFLLLYLEYLIVNILIFTGFLLHYFLSVYNGLY